MAPAEVTVFKGHREFLVLSHWVCRFQGGRAHKNRDSPAAPGERSTLFLVTSEQCISDQDKRGLTSLDCDSVALGLLPPRTCLSPPQWVPSLENRAISLSAGLAVGALRRQSGGTAAQGTGPG